MRATKGNREYIIDEAQVKAYQDSGFDVKDDDGNIVAYGKGKTVPYGTYMDVKNENKILLKQVEDLQTENSALRKQVEAAQAETSEEKTKEAGKRESKKAGE